MGSVGLILPLNSVHASTKQGQINQGGTSTALGRPDGVHEIRAGVHVFDKAGTPEVVNLTAGFNFEFHRSSILTFGLVG